MKTMTLALTLTASVLLVTSALAHGGATGIVKERMEAMKSLGAAGKALAAMVKGETAFDADAAALHARTMADHGGEAMTTLFPKGSLDAPTEALPAIWEDPERFNDLALALETRATALEVIVRSDELDAMRPAFAAVAETCGACHKTFRKEK